MSESVLRLSSPHINSMINDIKMVSMMEKREITIILPDVSINVIEHIKNILLTGSSNSSKKIEEENLLQIQEIAILLGLNFVNLDVKDNTMKETNIKKEPLEIETTKIKLEPMEYFETNETENSNPSSIINNVKEEPNIVKELEDKNTPTSVLFDDLPEPTPTILLNTDEFLNSTAIESTEELLIEIFKKKQSLREKLILLQNWIHLCLLLMDLFLYHPPH